MAKKKKSSFLFKLIVSVLIILALGAGFGAYFVIPKIFQPNVNLGENKTSYFYIPTGSTIEDVNRLLYEDGFVINSTSFEWLAKLKKFQKVYPGRYLIKAGMSNNELINMLRSGTQTPVKVTFNSIRTKEQLAGKVSSQIEADSISIISLLNDEAFLAKFGLNPDNILSVFLPNTYEFYWNTSAEKFLNKMYKEFNNFWTEEKRKKANSIGLTPIEVSVLASIVQAEQSSHINEKATIAGLYINRLNKGMRLESDPTLVYALGDFTIKRVLNVHKEIESPYNTYKYGGLPPGPINLPELSSLNAVLNYNKNDYIFMCAKEDFSGYHNFARTLEQHNVFASRYRAALNALARN